LALICPSPIQAQASSPNITDFAPTCGPTNSYSIVSITGDGFSNTSYVIFGTAVVPPSDILSVSPTSIVFVTPSVIPDVPSISLLVCDEVSGICEDTPTTFSPYKLPVILIDLTLNSTTALITGKNLQACGSSSVIRISSPSSIQDIPATVVSSSQLVFGIKGKSLSGVVSLALDGQHFDALSAKQLSINIGGGIGTSGGDPHDGNDSRKSEADRTVLWIVLGVIGFLAFAFLIFAVYKMKNRDEYSKLGW